MNIIDIAIRRPVFTTMITLALMVLGLVGIKYLDVDLFPDVSFPVVVISTAYPGASPEEVEQLVTKPIEDAVASLNGVDKLHSYSFNSLSRVIIIFKLEVPIKEAAVDVRDKVAAARGLLPRDIEDPVISRVDPAQAPIINYTISSPRPSHETRHLVDKTIKPALEQVPGVAAAIIQGGDVREIRVELDGNRLEALGLTAGAVIQTLGAQNLNVPAGRLQSKKQEISVRTVGQFKTVDDIRNAIIFSRAGVHIRVSDVGRVIDGFEEARLLARTNGKSAISLAIQKNSGSNTVEVVDGVKDRLDAIASMLPEDLAITEIFDQSLFIKENAMTVTKELVLGGLMAVFIIFVFMLDWRSTAISALALPTSVITTFFVMYLLDYSINMMTLLGLTLAIGLLIDDSIVVRENIFRHMENGEDPFTAARNGTKEISLAVLATTATVVAVFVPVAFSTGMIGQFFKQFGITVASATVVSTWIAFTLDPMLSARWVQKIEPGHAEKKRNHPVFGRFQRFYEGLDLAYRNVLIWSLAHKKTVALSATALFFGSCGLTGIMGTEFMTPEDRGQFTVRLELPPKASLDETDRAVRKAEAIMARNKEIKTIYAVIGAHNISGATLESNKAAFRIITTDKTERDASMTDIKDDIRERLSANLAGMKISIADLAIVEGAEEPPIQLNIRGDDYAQLQRIAEEAQAVAKDVPGIRDVSSTYVPGRPELQVRLDRDRAAELGVNPAMVGFTLRNLLEGDTTNKLRQGEDEYDIRVRLDPSQRADRMQLENLAFASTTGRAVYLREFAQITPASGPSTIERQGRRRQISINIYIGDRSLGDIVTDLKTGMKKIEMAPGYQIIYGGMAERMEESFGNLSLALALAIIFIYFVLASQFESFVHPFTIMLALPMAAVGAFTLLFLWGLHLGMPAMIGIVLLMGLVTKNSILLVDYTIQLRDRGLSLYDALIEAGPTRLRPILMTSAAIVLGMLPTALSNGPGSEFRQPMSVAVIGGVITSTFLTLVLVPVVYTWVDRFNRQAKRTATVEELAEEAKLRTEKQNSDTTTV